MRRARSFQKVVREGVALCLCGFAGEVAFAAINRPVTILDGNPTVRSLVSEDILLTQGGTTEFGSAVAFGDINGDGFADAVVGQRSQNKVYVYFGSAVPRGSDYFEDPGAADIVVRAPSGTSDRIQQFGFSVAALDLELDGFDDIIVGAPFSDPGGVTDKGLAFLVLVRAGLPGRSGDPPSAQSFTISTPPPGVVAVKLTRRADGKKGDLLGFAVGAGSLGSVSPPDTYLAISARDADAALQVDAGAVHVLKGSALAGAGGMLDLSEKSAVTFFGTDASDAFGESIATCDMDDSGDSDLFVGAVFGDGPFNTGLNRGEAMLFLGENIASGQLAGDIAASSADMTIHGATDGDNFGYSVACGDLNDDDHGDLVAGAIFADAPSSPTRPTAGEVYVLRGRDSQVDPNTPLRRELIDPATSAVQAPVDLSAADPNDPAPLGADLALFGATTADQLGFSVGVGDLDGDGIGDLLAGARRYDRDRKRVNVGATYALLGSKDFLNPARAGLTKGIDLHDGTARVLDDGFTPPADHLPNRVNGVILGASRQDHSSWAVAAGDLNGDGGDELMISAIGNLAAVPGFRGEAYILSFSDFDGDLASDLVDLDNDNDGILDLNETGTPGSPAGTFPLDPDSDDDLIQDGTELGLTCVADGGTVACDDPSTPFTGTDPNLPFFFRPDQDPDTMTNPRDRDTDDDAILDREEDSDHDGAADPGESDASNHDTDGDLIFDGTEIGRTAPRPGTDLAAGHFVPDADAGMSVTDPTSADTDLDGINDGVEDADKKGAVAGDLDLDHVVDTTEIWTETDPSDDDTDRDGLKDGVEDRDRDGAFEAGETDPLDQDTDDDGLPDGWIDGANGKVPIDGVRQGVEGEDLDRDGVLDPAGESNPRTPDTDADGLTDGIEVGLSGSGVAGRNGMSDRGPRDGTDANSANLKQDADAGASTTNPNRVDSDLDLLLDKDEDKDLNGAVAGDADFDHVVGTNEIWTETDAADADTDRDGLSDGLEDKDRDGIRDATETNPLDQDTDDDGLPDGRIDGANGAMVGGTTFEALEGEDLDVDGLFGTNDGESSPLLADSDGDALLDGLEAGVRPGGGVNGRNGTPDGGPGGDGTDTTSASFKIDADPNSMTEPWDADTDDDGLPDGFIDGHNPNMAGMGGMAGGGASVYEGEDINLDGAFVRVVGGETNPQDRDTDRDGVKDGAERGVLSSQRVKGLDDLNDPATGGVQDGTNGGPSIEYDTDDTTQTEATDADSDEDGLSDGTEDTMGNGAVDPGESDPNNHDSDGDLLNDGLEKGRVTPEMDTFLAAGRFTPDLDPNSMTNPAKADTDGGGTNDGAEDVNRNGRVDLGPPAEQNPNVRQDDDRTGVLEYTGTLNGAVTTTPIAPGTTLFLRLNDDTDENVDPNVSEVVTVSCMSTFPDTETATLFAAGPDTGVFIGSLSTTSAASANNSGALSLATGNSITCTYTDAGDPVDMRTAPLTAASTTSQLIPPLHIEISASGRLTRKSAGPSSVRRSVFSP